MSAFVLGPPRRLGPAAALLGLAAALCIADAAPAEDAAAEKKIRFTVSEYTYKRLDEAHRLLGKGQYQEVRKILDDLAGRRGLNEHEVALVHQTYGYLESAQGDHRKAAAAFEKCLAQNALPAATQLDVEYNLGQLYIATEQFERAVSTLEAWFAKAEKPPPHAFYLLAVAYARQGRTDLAVARASEAVQRSPAAREPWLQLLLSLHLERKDYARAADVLRELIAHFPRKTYWMQLSAVYGELGREAEALSVLQLAHAQGFLDQDREIRALAQMLLYQQAPYLAATILEKAMADKVVAEDEQALTLLADAWLSARDYRRALAPLERAAQQSAGGDLYVRLAQVYADQENWNAALAALEHALGKANLEDRGRALLLLGICRASTGDLAAARRALEQARQFERSRRAAEQWLRHVEQGASEG